MNTQIIINSLVTASIYGLTALGFALIYKVVRFVHFAHGAVVASGGFIFFWLFSRLELSLTLSLLLTIFLTGLLGLLVYNLIYYPFIRKKSPALILLTISLSLIIITEAVLQLVFGSKVQTVFIKANELLELAGNKITLIQLSIIVTTIFIYLITFLIFYKTKLGLIFRAVASNPQSAKSLGINSALISITVFFIASCIAGMAGISAGLEQNLSTTMGAGLILKGYTASVIGGITNPVASIIGSLIIGFFENLTVYNLSGSLKDGVTYTILFLFLLFRPNGLWQR